MAGINSIGGFIQVDFLFIDELTRFSISNYQVLLSIQPHCSWRNIPISYMQSQLASSGDPDSSVMEHTISLRITKNDLSDSLKKILSTINVRGCIIKLTTPDHQELIVGSHDYPLFGRLNPVFGKRAKDSAHYELTFAVTTPYPPLPFTYL